MSPGQQTITDFLNTMPATLYEYSQSQDGSGKIVYISPNCIDVLGYSSDKFVGKNLSSFLEITHVDDRERLEREDRETVNDPYFTTEVRVILPSKAVRWLRFRSKPASRSAEGTVKWVGCIVDITFLKQPQEEYVQRKGILPMCSFCKKVRNDKGHWDQVECYITEHMEVMISHGVCPDCLKEEFPDIDLEPRK